MTEENRYIQKEEGGRFDTGVVAGLLIAVFIILMFIIFGAQITNRTDQDSEGAGVQINLGGNQESETES